MFGFIVVSWFLTLGVVPLQYEQVDNLQTLQITQQNMSTVATLGLSAKMFDHFELYGSVETFQFKIPDELYFSPYRADYTFGARFYIVNGITLDFSHYCNHPVDGGGPYKNKYQGGETKLSVTFSGSIK